MIDSLIDAGWYKYLSSEGFMGCNDVLIPMNSNHCFSYIIVCFFPPWVHGTLSCMIGVWFVVLITLCIPT